MKGSRRLAVGACGVIISALVACGGGADTGDLFAPDDASGDGSTAPGEDAAGRDSAAGDSTTSDVTVADTGTDVSTGDATTSDGGSPDATAPDADVPDGALADGDVPDANGPDGTLPDGNTTDGDVPDGNIPDGNIPDTDVPDTNAPDTSVPDTGPDTSSACPPPVVGSVYVSPSGSDTNGNGSQTCPFVTITKALSTTTAASGATTIVIESGAVAPNIYGSGCTAGPGNCDATPIHVSDGMNKGIVFQGTSTDPHLVDIVGGTGIADSAVVSVSAPNVGFQNLTVSPRKVAFGIAPARVAGAMGIQFQAAAVNSGPEATVSNVIIDGIVHGNGSESTSNGIAMRGGTSPTIGPGVNIIGGDLSVLVTQSGGGSGGAGSASKPLITSSDAAPSFFHSAQFGCVRIESTGGSLSTVPTATLTSTSTTDPGRLHLQDCGGNGGVVVDTTKAGTPVDVSSTLIDSTGDNAAAFYGVRLQHLGVAHVADAVMILGINEVSNGVGAGIEATDTAKLSVTAGPVGVVVQSSAANGVHITGSASANIDGITSNGNRNGIVCDAANNGASANLTLRNSATLANKGAGVFVGARAFATSCLADLGGNSSGNNVYNRTSMKNGSVGLCYLAAQAVTVSDSTWSCGLDLLAACTPATDTVPTPTVVAACDIAGDHNQSAQLTVSLPQTCCGL